MIKTKKILFLVVLVSLLVGYIIFQFYTNQKKNISVPPTIGTTKPEASDSAGEQVEDNNCALFDKHKCLNSKECYPSYKQRGPSRDKVGMPLLNFYFDRCLSPTPEEIEQIEYERGLCDRKEGHWTETYGRPKGFCSLPAK